MRPSPAADSQQAILEQGTLVEGFRIEREIGRGRTSVVYEATQLSLGRAVALKVFDPDLSERPTFAERYYRRSRLQSALDHPGIVTIHEAGESEHGLYLARQLVAGKSLDELMRERALSADRTLWVLRQAAEALEAAHSAGLAHGDVTPRHVLVDAADRAYFTDFAMTAAATPEGDRAAFASMAAACLANGSAVSIPPAAQTMSALVDEIEHQLKATHRARRRRIVGVLAILIVAASTAGIAYVARGNESPRTLPPPVAEGAVALGSDLAAGAALSVDCNGDPASGASADCTVAQLSLPGRRVAVTRPGAIRRWSVRGARGGIALQVLRPSGGEYFEGTRSQLEFVPDESVHTFETDLQIVPGDLVGIHVTPGSSIGVRPGTSSATTSRWFGSLGAYRYRAPSLGGDTGFDFEILVRADYVPGAARRYPNQLLGPQAAEAPIGRELRSGEVELRSGVVTRIALVRLETRVVLDLYRGARRVARIDVPDADPSGTPLALEAIIEPLVPSGERLEWRNPDGNVIIHEYSIGPGSFKLIN